MSYLGSVREYIKIFFSLIKEDKKLLIITIIYGSIASIFNITLPLSIQYISSQIMANASILPIITISICLFVFLVFYLVIKVFQLIAFSYFEKRFFVRNTYKMFHPSPEIKKADLIQTYGEISNTSQYVASFIFTTSTLIQQIILGLIITAFYHLSFLIFNVLLIITIFLVFRIFFLRSIILYKKELDIRYLIGRFIHESCAEDKKINDLLGEYYTRKTSYFNILLKQNIIFLTLYITTNCMFLMMSGFLTLKGYITVPQFLASEMIFSLVFATLGEFTKNLKNIYEMLSSSKKIDNIAGDIKLMTLEAPKALMKHPSFSNKLIKTSLYFLICVLIGLVLIPWYQTSSGKGKIIAYNQDSRVQEITAMVSGRIVRWYANDGQFLQEGDKIAEIGDNDPDLVLKLEHELESVKMQYENSKLSTSTAKINYDRQMDLYEQGLTARKEFERAKIEYQRLLGYQNEIKAKLIQTDVKLSRQRSQIITAPKMGFLLQSQSKSISSYVYAGETIATFVPQITDPAVELFLSPNDMPLIHKGRLARIQIEGWPALRISGWPSTSLGTFGGIVQIVDNAISPNGMLRVVITPDPKDQAWPDMKYIKQGTKVVAWVSMNKVPIGYEIWRQMNGFPIKPDEPLFLKNKNEKKPN